MSTIRVARRDRGHFTQIDNNTIRDSRLSFRARGVLAWLLSHADDWHIDAEQIADQGAEGRDAIRTALRELRELGYIVSVKRRTAEGTFVWESTVYETAQEVDEGEAPGPSTGGKPGPGYPAAGNPAAGKPPSLEEEHEEEHGEEHQECPAVPAELPEATQGRLIDMPASFDEWWEQYPRRVSKKDAREAWDKMKPAERRAAFAAIPDHVAMWLREGRGTATMPYPASWLRGRCWEDELRYAPEGQQGKTLVEAMKQRMGERIIEGRAREAR